MPDASDVNDAIAANASDAIASATVRGETVITKDISQQIAAANHLNNAAAADRAHRGLRFTKIRPSYE